MTDQIARTALVYDASGAKAGADQFAQASAKIKGANQEVVTATERVETVLNRQSRALEALKRQADPAYAATQKLKQAEDLLSRSVERGSILREDADKVLEKLRTRYAQNAAAAGTLSRAHDGLTASTKLTGYQMRQLGFQAKDAFEQLVSGGGVFRTFAQQAPAAAEAVGGFGRAGTLAMRALLSPAAAAVAGIAAVGTMAVLVAGRIAEVGNEARRLDVISRSLNPRLSGAGGDLRSVSNTAVQAGASRSDAAAATEALARQRNLIASIADMQRLAADAVNIAAIKGGTAGDWATKLGEAFAKGAAGVQQLDAELGFLTPAQAATIRLLEEQGKRAQALGIAMDALSVRFGHAAMDMKSEWGKAITEMGHAWDAFLEALANSRPAKGLADQLATEAKALTALFSGNYFTMTPQERTQQFGTPGQRATAPEAVAVPAAPALRLPAMSNADVDALTRTVIAEAGNQGQAGMEAVARVILNRLQSGNFGRTVQDVVNQPRQFEPVGRAGGDWRNLTAATDEQRAMVERMIRDAVAGKEDPTKGSLYFQNTRITDQRGTNFAKGTPPAVQIGDHSFYQQLPGSRNAPGGSTAVAGLSADEQKRLDEVRHAYDRETESMQGTVAERQVRLAGLHAEEEALAKGESADAAKQQRLVAEAKATRDLTVTIDDQNRNLDVNARMTLAVAAAYEQSTAAGIKADAERQAAIEALTTGVNAADRANRLLWQKALEGYQAGAMDIARMKADAANLQSIAGAAGRGPAAQQAAQRSAETEALYRERIAAATASGDTDILDRLQKQSATYTILLEQRDKYNRQIQAAADVRGEQNTIESLQTESRLIGATVEQRAKEIGLLQLRQRLIAQGYSGTELETELERQGRLVEQSAMLSGQVERSTRAYEDLKATALEGLDAIGGAFEDLIFKGSSFKDVIKSLEQSLLHLGWQALVMKPLQNWLESGTAGSGSTGIGQIAGWIGSLFGGTTAAAAAHSGGIAGRDGTVREIPTSVFVNAPRMHRGGIAPGEVPVILQSGEEVLTDRDPRHRRNGGYAAGGTVVNLHISTPDVGGFRSSQNQITAEMARGLAIAQRRNR